MDSLLLSDLLPYYSSVSCPTNVPLLPSPVQDHAQHLIVMEQFLSLFFMTLTCLKNIDQLFCTIFPAMGTSYF